MTQKVFSNQLSPKHSHVFNRLIHIQKKREDRTRYPSHTLRPWDCPSCLNEQHQDPTPIRWLYNTPLCPYPFGFNKSHDKDIGVCQYKIIPVRHLLLLCPLTGIWNFSGFRVSRTKRQANASYVYTSPPFIDQTNASAWERDKITYFLHSSQIRDILILVCKTNW